MYAFNAIQIVTIYAALPLGIQYCYEHGWRAGLVGLGLLFTVGSIFLVVGATRNLYSIDKEFRHL